VKRLGVNAHVTGSGLVVRGNVVRSLQADVAGVARGDDRAPLRFRVGADSVETSGRAFERIDANGRWSDRTLTGDVRVRQDSLVSYAALGTYARPDSVTTVVKLDSLRATFDTLVWRLAHPATVRLADGSVAIDSVDLRSSAGERLFAAGRVPKEGRVSLDVAAERVRIATVLRALQRDPDGDGEIGMTAHVSGTRAQPEVDGRLTLRDARWEGTRAPDANVALGYRDRRAALRAEAHDSTGRRVLSGTASLPYDLALEKVSGSRRLEGPITADVVMDSLPLAAIPLRTRSLTDLRGKLGADLRVRGTWREPQYRGQAGLRDGGLTLASTMMRVDDAVADLTLTGDTLRLDSLVARAGGPMRASGIVDLTDRAHPFVRATASGTELRLMHQRRGEVEANAEISAVGPLSELRVTGRGEMLRGYLALKSFRKDLLRVKSPGDLAFVSVFDTSRAAERQRPRRDGAPGEAQLRDRRRPRPAGRPRQLLSQPAGREHRVLHGEGRGARRAHRSAERRPVDRRLRADSPAGWRSSARSHSCRPAAASPSARTPAPWGSCSRWASGSSGSRGVAGCRCSCSRGARRRCRRSGWRAARCSRSAAAS
jgi:hypothetical protein